MIGDHEDDAIAASADGQPPFRAGEPGPRTGVAAGGGAGSGGAGGGTAEPEGGGGAAAGGVFPGISKYRSSSVMGVISERSAISIVPVPTFNMRGPTSPGS